MRGGRRSAPPAKNEVAAIAQLLRYSDPLRGPGWNPRTPADPGRNVPRTRALLDLAGAPDRALTCVIVAGTKGKGSTAAFLASILHRAGVRAGLYTSPHLQSWRERIRVDGVAIAPAAFAREVDIAVRLARRLARGRPDLGDPTAFELLTVAALAHFARRRCRVAILEVGLGGRFDATNAVDPAVSVITSIGLDHQAILGRSLGRIASEKAGVLRQGRPAVLARQRPSADRALLAACRSTGAPCVRVSPVSRSLALGLAGDHQRQNAALAREAARDLRHVGVAVDDRAIAEGLRRAWWPGRLEIARGRPTVLLDGAHTAESASALAAELSRRGRRVRLVFGCTADRDPRAIARPLLPLAMAVYATAASGPRAMPPERTAGALGGAVAGTYPTVAEALTAARRAARARGLVCVTGSLAVVGEARSALGLGVPERLWR